jgi:hypothetical protein
MVARRRPKLQASARVSAEVRAVTRLSSFIPIAIGLVTASGCLTARPARDPGPAEPSVEVVPEQEILTPVPVRARLPARLGVDSVALRYRTRGTRDWSSTELFRAGQTWSGEVPCREVSTITGDLQYYLVARNSGGRLIATSGTASWPHVTSIRYRLPSGARGLPGELPEWRCPDPADCPPGFPGCPSQELLRPACSSNGDCDRGYCAWDGYCATPENPS